ncbi:cupin domain-containing protein [Leifsonia sp. EB34]|uniref:cupin domain-containing protein n=1 Tax=Leifsonia sp. EB34 TaxID=3156303 RepID=UPI003519C7F2
MLAHPANPRPAATAPVAITLGAPTISCRSGRKTHGSNLPKAFRSPRTAPAGGSTDVESEEVIVLSGRATIEFTDRGERLEIAVGDIVHLHAGDRTVWRVTEALRKVYFQHCDQPGQSK